MTVPVPDTELSPFWVHTAAVETYTGTTGSGVRTYAASVTVPGYLERKRQFVRAANGEQVISTTQFYGDSTLAPLFAPLSRVTLDEGATTVISRETLTSGDLGLPDHVAVYLQ